MDNEKRTCFIITPIGGEKDDIRRHIDGVINTIITPIMESDYEIKVAHRIFETGSITKQIIELIYNSDLVIANLTQTNPNVMYELAFRHTLGLPTITMAEKGTKLPFDISSERTIFYRNDFEGVNEAQTELKNYLSQIDYSNGKTTGPIHDYLDSVELSNLISIHNQSQNQNQNSSEALDLIVKRLECIENAIPNISRDIMLELSSQNIKSKVPSNEKILFTLQNAMDYIENIKEILLKALASNDDLESEEIEILREKIEHCQLIINHAINIINKTETK